jgi:hypothetical protein
MLCVWYVHLTKVKHIYRRQTHSLVREDVTQGLWPQGVSYKKKKKKIPVLVYLQWLGGKTNLLAVSRQSLILTLWSWDPWDTEPRITLLGGTATTYQSVSSERVASRQRREHGGRGVALLGAVTKQRITGWELVCAEPTFRLCRLETVS